MEPNLKKLADNWKNYLDHDILDENTRPIIQRSWSYCKKHGIDVNEGKGAAIDSAQIEQILEKNQELLKIARPIMQNLYEIVLSSHFVLVLTDKNGILLDTIGDEIVSMRASELRFLKGTVWTTDAVGTNAIGLALDEDAPVHVVGAEHYCISHHTWTCSATTIHNVKGEVIGCLNMSGESRKLHSHTLGIVVAAAYSIENELALSHTYRSMNASLNSTEDGIFVTDENLNLQWMNYGAQKVLHLNMDQFNAIGFNNIFKKMDVSDESWNPGESTRYYTDVTAFIGNQKIPCSANISRILENDKIQGYSIGIREIKHLHTAVNRVSGNVASYTFDDIITQNAEMKIIIKTAEKMARFKKCILIEGESGTGKEMFAHSIHKASHFSAGPFIVVNCACLPRDLVESELFGYVKGAFTGALNEGKPGKFELAEGGTIFLDEIGELPLEIQAKLLRVVETYSVSRIGSQSERKLNIRIIVATNRNLEQEVQNKNFREDLYFRLNVIYLHIPPLRVRGDDILWTACYFLDRLNLEYPEHAKTFAPDFLEGLKFHHWPGNVRELQNFVERTFYLCTETVISKDYLPLSERKNVTINNVLPLTHNPSLDDLVKSNLEKILKQTHGSVEASAEIMGLSRASLYRKIKKYKIDIKNYRCSSQM
ncbi:sigma-54-dependent Fis family transcriptional regulator [Acetobacterium woodii]|uniref:Acetoin dehydrogenase operon transcriptional activator AcoR n=1 Tax=Acetobacterium woodii (strain ATCC 29683 / DSM 1030 / JCM 2381 / KCTC 1655 / WB1) TaxID=931626 RepID=H6LFN7_ACEWD|nr:sigma-54-dependent Fis family transcriptional regulator [Acetobacterium woodii]AFA46982.1 acetoin dehydrogenase operon transcriptional activator AcoR [Acetobacterium woodii DSM 1030]